MIESLIASSRSCRRFYEDREIERDTLLWLANLARLSPSSGNLQPLKFMLSHDPIMNDMIFSCLVWANYLEDWPGPPPGERPSAYIVMLGDTTITQKFVVDQGIAAQSMMLGARERGLGGVMMGAIKRERMKKLLDLPDSLKILLVLALGVPKEDVVVCDMPSPGDVKYWRDEAGVHHVPKRALKDIIVI